MAVKLPQVPLLDGNQEPFYPLTHASQIVINENGERLLQNEKIIADTAADSAKLGGKAPEYYIQPRNLLDNSDFRNPVNQRGQTSYSGDWSYSIDRWMVCTMYEQNPTGSINITENGLSVGYWTDLMQLIPFDSLKSKTLTFAACTENGVSCFSLTVPEYVSGTVYLGDGIWNDQVVMEVIKYENSENIMFRVRNALTTNQLVYWAALYEGSYTAETLPPYVPKGYAAELAECQRYFRRIKSEGNVPLVTVVSYHSRAAYGAFHFGFRVNPTVTIDGILAVTNSMTNGKPAIQIMANYTGNSVTGISASFADGSLTPEKAYTLWTRVKNEDDPSISGGRIDFDADLH